MRGRKRRDDLPGPDDDAQSGAARRHPDDRGDHGARAGVAGGRARPRARRARRRSASRRRRSGSTPIRTSSPAACASASRSRSRCCTGPQLIIADEPTTALDVTIQSQILAEVQTLAADTGTALIWITHDLAVVAGLADRIAVMYAGRIVEEGPVDAVLDAAAASLYARTDRLGAEPQPARRGRSTQIPGMPPSLLHLPPGCAFAPRCARADAVCDADAGMLARAGARAAARCWHPHRAGGRRRHDADHRARRRQHATSSQPLDLAATHRQPARRRHAARRWCTRSTASTSRSARARSSAWSASPAAASRRSGRIVAGIHAAERGRMAYPRRADRELSDATAQAGRARACR